MSDSREDFIDSSSSSDIHLFRARSQMSKIHKEILYLWEKNTRWCMICKQTYSYTTPLPPSLTEIFFPSEETSPSPLTTCVPFSVVSTSTAAEEVKIFAWRCLHSPGSCWCGETSRKPAGHQEHLPSVESLVSTPAHVHCGAWWPRRIVHYSKL